MREIAHVTCIENMSSAWSLAGGFVSQNWTPMPFAISIFDTITPSNCSVAMKAAMAPASPMTKPTSRALLT